VNPPEHVQVAPWAYRRVRASLYDDILTVDGDDVSYECLDATGLPSLVLRAGLWGCPGEDGHASTWHIEARLAVLNGLQELVQRHEHTPHYRRTLLACLEALASLRQEPTRRYVVNLLYCLEALVSYRHKLLTCQALLGQLSDAVP
jgi:hypothetical protein